MEKLISGFYYSFIDLGFKYILVPKNLYPRTLRFETKGKPTQQFAHCDRFTVLTAHAV